MRVYFKTAVFLLVAAVFASAFSCTFERRKATDYPPPLEPGKFIATGEYQKALDIYRLMYEKKPKNPVISHKYIRTIEDIKRNANIAFDREDFPSAGRIYMILLTNYDNFGNFEQLLSFDREFLNMRISECRKTLFNRGIEEYRKGNIMEAIALWESQLIFDPDNAEVVKAIDTAKLQLKTLQEKQ